MKTLFLLLTGCLLSAAAFAETAEEGVKWLESAWRSGNGFGDDFARVSKEIADRHGIAVIAPVMARSKTWKGEEGIIYALMIAFLPREEAVRELKRYQKREGSLEAIWAGEYITEFEASDTRSIIEKRQ